MIIPCTPVITVFPGYVELGDEYALKQVSLERKIDAMTTNGDEHPENSRHAWFDDARLGLFVHFGLYSTLARHEWVMTRERISPDKYEQYADLFDPDHFDAHEIARLAKEAGMGYAVLTTKHHDGFCLWDSKTTDYTSQAHQQRDFVREWVDALRSEGIRVGLYYSLLDWHHPDFTIDYHHPLRDTPGAHALNDHRDMSKYRSYLHEQVRELLTEYGQIDYMFFDFTYDKEVDGWKGKGPEDWNSDALLKMCRNLQPKMIINDRLGIPGDIVTPEQYQPSEPIMSNGKPVRWEACQTLNGSWGYDRDNTDYKSTGLILRMLADTVSKGGNLLLNIGPDGRGSVTPHDMQILTSLSQWMRDNRDSIHGAGASSFKAPPNTVITQRADRVYVHLFSWPFVHIHLHDMADQVKFTRLLGDGSEIHMIVLDPSVEALTTQPGGQPLGTVTLELPVVEPESELPVIELFLNTSIDQKKEADQ